MNRRTFMKAGMAVAVSAALPEVAVDLASGQDMTVMALYNHWRDGTERVQCSQHVIGRYENFRFIESPETKPDWVHIRTRYK